MNVAIKKFNVQMDVKNAGIEFEVRESSEPNTHIGDMVLNKAGMIWCDGQTRRENGNSKSWKEIIEFFNS